jgi:glycosyltransferase involved in cell wall biosynthesis
MVARTRYRLPLSPSLARKFDALERRFDLRVLGSAADGSAAEHPTFRLAPRLPKLDGPAFWAALPFRVARELRRFRPQVVIVQGPYEGAAVLAARALARVRAPLVVELHGDWRTFPRLYGSRLRTPLAPVTDRLAPWVLRRAEAVKTLSEFTSAIARDVGVEPAAEFTAFADLAAFTERPPARLPDEPSALFVGVLERYKNIDGVAAAWRLAAPRVPHARLRLVGRGSRPEIVEALVTDLPEQTSWESALSTAEIVRALDESWSLLLPSRSEGTPRIVLEAMCRGRAVVGSRAGGIPDVIDDGVNGILVDSEDHAAIADALVRVLSDREHAERLGAAAHERSQQWLFSPEEYAARIADVVERVALP